MGGPPFRGHLLPMQNQDPLQEHDPRDQDGHGLGLPKSDPTEDHQNSPNGGDQAAHQDKPQTGVHFLRLDKAYLRCDLCKSYILARSNEQTFEEFVG